MLVHAINHRVAEPPEEEQRCDEEKGDGQVFSVTRGEHALFVVAHKLLKGCLRSNAEDCARVVGHHPDGWRNKPLDSMLAVADGKGVSSDAR
jgi:hypothetical protein